MRVLRLFCASVLLGLCEACLQHQYYNSHRLARSHLFVRDEYEPKVRELHLLASGPVTSEDFVRNPNRLERATDPDIEFRTESSRRMTKVRA